MDKPDVALARLVVDQHGMVTAAQAAVVGVSEWQRRSRSQDGLLIPMHRAIFRHAAVPLTRLGRLEAAVLAGGEGAVASHRSAALLHGLRNVPRWRPEVTTPATCLPRAGGVQFHRTNRLDWFDVTIVQRIRCTTVARTLLDLGALLPYEMVEHTTQDAVIRKLVTLGDLKAVLERIGGRGRRGSASLRAVVRHALPDERIESELERRLALLLPSCVNVEPQYQVVCADGRKVRLDFAEPRLKVAIEANGHRWHATSRDLRRDMERRRSVTASGWRHYEYGWSDVTERAADVSAELLAILTTSSPS